MNEAFLIVSVALAISATVNLALGIGWFSSLRRLRRLEKQEAALAPDERTAHLEQVVDGLGAQLDQLASGQEFLNRVLTERLARPQAPAEEPSEITPH
jgi:hypothetical protein